MTWNSPLSGYCGRYAAKSGAPKEEGLGKRLEWHCAVFLFFFFFNIIFVPLKGDCVIVNAVRAIRFF